MQCKIDRAQRQRRFVLRGSPRLDPQARLNNVKFSGAGQALERVTNEDLSGQGTMAICLAESQLNQSGL